MVTKQGKRVMAPLCSGERCLVWLGTHLWEPLTEVACASVAWPLMALFMDYVYPPIAVSEMKSLPRDDQCSFA